MALVIIGLQRSGTTLLMKLCDGHPDLTVTEEFGNFFHLNEPYGQYASFILRRWWQKKNAPISLAQKRGMGRNMVQNLFFIMRYLQKIHLHLRDLVDPAVVDAALRSLFPDTKIVGDKHPDYAYIFDRLVKIEGLSCVYIYRDPRDVVSSTVKMARTSNRKWWPAELREASGAAKRWVDLIELVEQYSDDALILRYEDLVTNPKQVLNGLGGWLEIDPNGFPCEIIHDRSIGNYRKGLTTEEIADVISIAGDKMSKLGYSS